MDTLKRIVRLSVALTAVMTLVITVGPRMSAYADSQTATLQTESGRSSCPDGGAAGAAHGTGSINETEGSEEIAVDVSLTGAAPNRSFDVHLVQCVGEQGQRSVTDATSGARGESFIGTFVTDGDGNGTFHGAATEADGVMHAFVGLFGGPDQIYATNTVQI
jgi:hypothetical protein